MNDGTIIREWSNDTNKIATKISSENLDSYKWNGYESFPNSFYSIPKFIIFKQFYALRLERVILDVFA